MSWTSVLSKISTLSPDVHRPNVLREGRVVGMEVSIQGPLPAYSRMRDGFDDSGTGRGIHLSLSPSLSGVSCIHGKVGLAFLGIPCVLCLTLQSSVPGLGALGTPLAGRILTRWTRKPQGLWHPEWPPVTWEGVGMPVAHASMGGHHTPTHPS